MENGWYLNKSKMCYERYFDNELIEWITFGFWIKLGKPEIKIKGEITA